MPKTRLAGASIGLLFLVAAVSANPASAKGVLLLSNGGAPVAQGAEVAYSLTFRPEGSSGYGLQVGGGPLVNEAKVDGFTTNEGGDAVAPWSVNGTIEAIALKRNGKATVTATGETLTNNEIGPPPPPPPPLVDRGSAAECSYPLPNKLKGTFSTSGVAVVMGTTKAKPSKACHLPGFGVSFTLELVPSGQSGPPLETSLVQ